MNEKIPQPTEIKCHKKSRLLDVTFNDGQTFSFSFEYLRVFSPSAEVRGHGPGEGILQTGKESVDIINLEPVGQYAIKIHFDDGHDTGLYSWQWLYQLGTQQEQNWQRYLERLKTAGIKREQ